MDVNKIEAAFALLIEGWFDGGCAPSWIQPSFRPRAMNRSWTWCDEWALRWHAQTMCQSLEHWLMRWWGPVQTFVVADKRIVPQVCKTKRLTWPHSRHRREPRKWLYFNTSQLNQCVRIICCRSSEWLLWHIFRANVYAVTSIFDRVNSKFTHIAACARSLEAFSCCELFCKEAAGPRATHRTNCILFAEKTAVSLCEHLFFGPA